MRKLAIFSGAFVLLTAVYVYLLRDVRALWLAGAFVLLSAVGRMLKLRRVSIAALGAAIGLLWCYGYQTVWLGPIETISGTEQTVQVEVLSLPRSTRTGMAADVELALETDDFPAPCMQTRAWEKLVPETGCSVRSRLRRVICLRRMKKRSSTATTVMFCCSLADTPK